MIKIHAKTGETVKHTFYRFCNRHSKLNALYNICESVVFICYSSFECGNFKSTSEAYMRFKFCH